LPITTHHPPPTTHNLPIIVYLFTFSRKTNPISKNAQINVTSLSTMSYENMGPSATRKKNPKRTQTNPNKANPTPIFRPLSHPKAKTNPSKPKANPIYRGQACLPRRSPLPSRDGEAGTNPISVWAKQRNQPPFQHRFVDLKKIQNFLRFLLQCSEYGVILYYITEDVMLCS